MRVAIFTIAIWAMVYSYGALAFTNTVLDPSAGSDSVTLIRDRRIHVSGGVKGSSVWHEVSLDASATPGAEPWIHVRPDLYDAFTRGETACVHTGAGLLAVSWFEVRPCSATFR